MQHANGKMDRRDFMKSSALAAAGAVGAVSTAASAAEKKEVDLIGENKFKVIDFRCRPPLKSFGGLFKMRIGMFEKRPNVLANPATFGKAPASVQAFAAGKKEAMDLWWKEIDACGIEAVVVAGRYMEGQPEMSMDTDKLLEYEGKYKDRFYGIAPINIDQPIYDRTGLPCGRRTDDTGQSGVLSSLRAYSEKREVPSGADRCLCQPDELERTQ